IGPRLGVSVWPYWDPYWDPYWTPYAVPPVVAPPPQVYIQPAPPTWYYCDNPQGYYPYVQQCPGGWRPVAPTPPAGDPTNNRSYRGNAPTNNPATTSSSTTSSGGSARKAMITRSSTAETTSTPAPPGNALVERATAECALWRGSARERPCIEHRIQALTNIEAMRSNLHFVQAQQDCAYTRDSIVLDMCLRLKLQELNSAK